jgi:acyl-coenzyme A synthetase/AMP-(fatty) acid ligase
MPSAPCSIVNLCKLSQANATISDRLRAHYFSQGTYRSVKAPKQVDTWPDLPRSKVGKVLKKEIRAKILSCEKDADPGGDAERERDLKRR